MSAGDIRYGRRGGRWKPKKDHDQAAIEAWQAQQAAVAAALEASGEQLTIDDALGPP